MIFRAVTGCSSAKLATCGFCVCGMSKKPTPLIWTTAPSGCQWFMGFPAVRFELLPHSDHRLSVTCFLGDALGSRHLSDQVVVATEQDEVNITVAVEPELDYLGRHPPDLPAEGGRACLRRSVRLGERVDRCDRGVLRVKVDKLALRIAQRLQPLQADVAAVVTVRRS